MKIEFYGLPVVKLTDDGILVWIDKMSKEECFEWLAQNKPTLEPYSSDCSMNFAGVSVFETNHIMALYFSPHHR